MATKKKKQIAVVLENPEQQSDWDDKPNVHKTIIQTGVVQTVVAQTTDVLVSATDIRNIQSAKENEPMINRTNDLFDI